MPHRSVIYVLLTLVPLVGLLLNCGHSASESEPNEQPGAAVSEQPPVSAPPPAAATRSVPQYRGVPTLEWTVARYPVIVRGQLSSVEATILEYGDGKFRPALKFYFGVLETLAGAELGGSVQGFWMHGESYDTRAEASAKSQELVAMRDTQWDDREAILFLHKPPSGAGTALPEHFLPTSSHYLLGWGAEFDIHDDFHSLYSRYDRRWLPATGVGRNQTTFMLELPPSAAQASGGMVNNLPSTAHPNGHEVTLAQLRTIISQLTADMNSGDGSSAHRDCVIKTYHRRSFEHHFPTLFGTRGEWDTVQSIASGQAAGTVVDEIHDTILETYTPGTPLNDLPVHRTLIGRDAAHFAVSNSEGEPFTYGNSTQHNSYGYYQRVQTARPLPAGTYEFTQRHPWVCNNVDIGWTYDWTITVTAPEGTLHEALFDPVTDGSAVAADDTNGQLEPTGFTDANGASATIQRIEWASDTVKVKVSPHTGLEGHRLDFIELDGTVSLSLVVDEATVDPSTGSGQAGTLSWTVAEQPWHDGDLLMLRIYR